MSKGYWIVRVDVTDQEQFKQYVAANADAFKKYGAKYLVRAGQFSVPEAHGHETQSWNFRLTKPPSIAGIPLNIRQRLSSG